MISMICRLRPVMPSTIVQKAGMGTDKAMGGYENDFHDLSATSYDAKYYCAKSWNGDRQSYGRVCFGERDLFLPCYDLHDHPLHVHQHDLHQHAGHGQNEE